MTVCALAELWLAQFRDMTGSLEVPWPMTGAAHRSTKFSSEREFQCPRCSKQYHWKHSLRFHMRNECGKAPHLKCPVCDYKSKQKSNLKTHVKIRHPLEFSNYF
ncbi:hypothetical protein PR048_000145 [Dryococelus australis]|uniref:C2H2-type domain-containing protein n=1 Tax=Dryococelus australis TaxID=614101 RepID=A0ABQ9IDT6_9NEOP|nr:hypothetical protein PR048_000145 [Dryococelus australis]